MHVPTLIRWNDCPFNWHVINVDRSFLSLFLSKVKWLFAGININTKKIYKQSGRKQNMSHKTTMFAKVLVATLLSFFDKVFLSA